MKKDIHPQYHQTTITCSCGNTFEVGSTVENVRIEICSACHPFYTGKQKLVDTARRVEKFQEKLNRAQSVVRKHASKTAKRSALRARRSKKATATDDSTQPSAQTQQQKQSA